MKANKALKRLAKIEALMSDVTERYSSAPHIREVLQDAKAAVTRAKEAVSLQASSGTAKNPLVKHSKPPSKATPEPSKPKRKLSAAGRKAIIAATNKRWARVRAAKAQQEKAVRKKAAGKKALAKASSARAAKKTAPVKKAAATKATPKQTAPAPAQAVMEATAQ
jgi:hypothetical protein